MATGAFGHARTYGWDGSFNFSQIGVLKDSIILHFSQASWVRQLSPSGLSYSPTPWVVQLLLKWSKERREDLRMPCYPLATLHRLPLLINLQILAVLSVKWNMPFLGLYRLVDFYSREWFVVLRPKGVCPAVNVCTLNFPTVTFQALALCWSNRGLMLGADNGLTLEISAKITLHGI